MANWVTHTMIAGRLIELGLDMEPVSFCVGNIAPDCNIENADWSGFEPSREVTHWMRGDKKDSADFRGFYEEHVRGRNYAANERAFFMGYFAHLVTDVEFHMFLHSPAHVEAMYERLAKYPEMYACVNGLPETFDTIKAVFGRRGIYRDIAAAESRYLKENPGSMFENVLCRVKDFPDLAPWLPKGAIGRKIPIMTAGAWDAVGDNVFFTGSELEEFSERACRRVLAEIRYMEA